MSLKMPEPDGGILARRQEIVAAMRAIVPGEGVIDDESAMRPFETDALTAYRQLPLVVVLPETTEQVSRVLAWCDPAPRSPAAPCRWRMGCCSP